MSEKKANLIELQNEINALVEEQAIALANGKTEKANTLFMKITSLRQECALLEAQVSMDERLTDFIGSHNPTKDENDVMGRY